MMEVKIWTYAVVVCSWFAMGVLSGVAQEVRTLDDLKRVEAGVQLVAEKAAPATVAIVAGKGSTGSGVIVSEQGLIFTASHVVMGEDKVSVIFADGKVEQGVVLGANYNRDEAIVQLVNPGPYPWVPLGDSDQLKVGDYVVALGHSAGFDPARRVPVRAGRMVTDGKQRYMISECTLVGGDSGGPLFDLEGRLVGIHSSIGSSLAINNHVPISSFIQDKERLMKGEHWGELGSNIMEDPDAPALGLSPRQVHGGFGVEAQVVYEGSPAAAIGMLPGDMIVMIRGHEIKTIKDFMRELSGLRAGEPVPIVICRQGEYYKAEIVPMKRSQLVEITKADEQRRRN